MDNKLARPLWILLCVASICSALTVGCGALQPLNTTLDDEPLAASSTVVVETHVNADWTNVQSRSEDGLAMLGNPDAPVTFIDYSDFL